MRTPGVITFGIMGAAAVLWLSVIAAPARAASQVAPVVGNACFEPAPAPANPLTDGALASARWHGSIQAHRSYFQACPATRFAAGSPRRSTKAMRRGIAPGRRFRDCAQCPEMVVVPAGSFMMGSKEFGEEGPVHRVTIGKTGTDQNAAIHLYTHERACPEARSARGRGVSNNARARQRPWISAVSARADSRAA